MNQQGTSSTGTTTAPDADRTDPPQSLNITGDFTCDGEPIQVSGDVTEATITGTCAEVSISGSGHDVRIEAAWVVETSGEGHDIAIGLAETVEIGDTQHSVEIDDARFVSVAGRAHTVNIERVGGPPRALPPTTGGETATTDDPGKTGSDELPSDIPEIPRTLEISGNEHRVTARDIDGDVRISGREHEVDCGASAPLRLSDSSTDSTVSCRA